MFSAPAKVRRVGRSVADQERLLQFIDGVTDLVVGRGVVARVAVARAWPAASRISLRRFKGTSRCGRLALNLSRVHAGTGNGPELTRTCANRNGEEWHETCTLGDDQHRYEVAVDTTSYPYPPAVMRGDWYVEEGGTERVRIGMDFRFQPRRGLWGRVFVAAIHAAFPAILGRILRGWRREIAARMSAGDR